MLAFQPATKQQLKLRMALSGPSGSGKTYTALTLAQALGRRVAVIDTERRSASKYAHRFTFDVLELTAETTFAPRKYIEAIGAAEAAGYEVLVIDSLTHAWVGKGGVLEMVDMATARSRSKNAFTEGWRDATPEHAALIDAILQCRMHVIATMRVKTEWVIEDDGKGKKVPHKIGLAPVQRQGLEYEFDIVADMDMDNRLVVAKTRCEALLGAVISKPDKKLADTIIAWLTDAATSAQPIEKAALTTGAPTAPPAKDPTSTDYWSCVFEEAKFTREQGQRILDEWGGNYAHALAIVHQKAKAVAQGVAL